MDTEEVIEIISKLPPEVQNYYYLRRSGLKVHQIARELNVSQQEAWTWNKLIFDSLNVKSWKQVEARAEGRELFKLLELPKPLMPLSLENRLWIFITFLLIFMFMIFWYLKTGHLIALIFVIVYSLFLIYSTVRLIIKWLIYKC